MPSSRCTSWTRSGKRCRLRTSGVHCHVHRDRPVPGPTPIAALFQPGEVCVTKRGPRCSHVHASGKRSWQSESTGCHWGRPLECQEIVRIAANMEKPLSAAESRRVDRAIASDEFQSLRPGKWLNDEAINRYFSLLLIRARRGIGKNLIIHHSFLSRKFASLSEKGKLRWVRKTKNTFCTTTVNDAELVLVPIHVENNHWILLTADLQRKQLRVLDSLCGRVSESVVEGVIQWLRMLYPAETWFTFPNVVFGDLGVQRDGYNCGVFMCKIAEYLALGLRVKWTSGRSDHARRRMVLDLLQNSHEIAAVMNVPDFGDAIVID